MKRTPLTVCFLALAMMLAVGATNAKARKAKANKAKVKAVGLNKCTAYCEVWAHKSPNTDTRWKNGMLQFHRVKPGKTHWFWVTKPCGRPKNLSSKKGEGWAEPQKSKGGCPGWRYYYKPRVSGVHKVAYTSRSDIKSRWVTFFVDKPVDNTGLRKDVQKVKTRVKNVEDRTDQLEKRPGYGYLGLSVGVLFSSTFASKLDPGFYMYGVGIGIEVWKPKKWFALKVSGLYSGSKPTMRRMEGNPVNEYTSISNHQILVGLGLVFKVVRKKYFSLYLGADFLGGAEMEQLQSQLVYQNANNDVVYEEGDVETRFVLGGRVWLAMVLARYLMLEVAIRGQGSPYGAKVPFSNPAVPARRESTAEAAVECWLKAYF